MSTEITAADRTEDLACIQRALTQAVHEALLAHKRAGNSVAVWSDGQVVWVAPEDIPAEEQPGSKGEE